jgi:CBS domain-containing protein
VTTTDLVEIGSAPAVTCSATASIAQAARVMAEHNVGSVVVVDDDGCVAGVITDRDIAVRAVSRELAPDTEVGSIMSNEVVSVGRTADLATAARQMATRGCRRLPVVDEEGRVVAVVSAEDLYRVGSEVLSELDRVLGRARRGGTQLGARV